MTSTFRIAWRKMAATTGFRTLYPAIVPPGTAHIDGIITAGPIETVRQVAAGAVASSLLTDYLFRSSGKANIHHSDFINLVLGNEHPAWPIVAKLYLQLNCLTFAYAPLWEEITGEKWTTDTPLRNAWERQLAQIEIDALVALSLGVTADELCMIYRTQFPVMRRYDQEDFYDVNGRKVPKEVLKEWIRGSSSGENTSLDFQWAHPQSSHTYKFEAPFKSLDRETEIRTAFSRFLTGSLEADVGQMLSGSLLRDQGF